MRKVFLWLAMFFVAVFSTACVDSPTFSTESSAGGVSHGRTYVLEPVVVIGKPGCDPYTDINFCEGDSGGACMASTLPNDTSFVHTAGCAGGGGSTGGTGGTGGSGGSGSSGGTQAPCPDYGCEASPPSTTDGADDELVDCVDLGCALRDATEAERNKVEAEIEEIRDDGFCGEIKASARVMINRHLQVWSNRVTIKVDGKDRPLLGEAPWDYTRGGPVMYLYTGAINSWTIAHEATHGVYNPSTGLYYTHSNITPLGLDLDQTAKYCSGN